jgi:hypothetical protein
MLYTIYTYFNNNQKVSKKSKIFFRVLAVALGTTAMVWNIDVGIFCVLGWIIVVVYNDILFTGKWKILNILKEIIIGILPFIFFAIVFEDITFTRVGLWINIKDILFGQASFSSWMNNVNIPIVHPWLCLGTLYAFSMGKSIRIFAKSKSIQSEKKNTLKLCLLF